MNDRVLKSKLSASSFSGVFLKLNNPTSKFQKLEIGSC